MKASRWATLAVFCSPLVAPALTASGQEAPDVLAPASLPPSEAPTGLGGPGNGLVDPTTHAADRDVFDEVEEIDEGLGPIYNAQACRECHQTPVSGASSQVTELRAGHRGRRGRFEDPVIPIGDGSVLIQGRSLVNDRAICPSDEIPDLHAQEHVPASEDVRTLRASLSTLGDGFVEAIPDSTLRQIADDQCRSSQGGVCGEVVLVPVLEAGGRLRAGRFGWKAQHASLLSFAADAYLNEMGITSDLLPEEVTTLCDEVADPEDEVAADGLADIDRFARFMRATQAPPRHETLARDPDAITGSQIFEEIGCVTCHVDSMTTAPPGSSINGGTFVVPEALGNKVVHPYSDFLLHDVGTGDGIVQSGGLLTARKLRTPPLWGLRLRSRFMHDVASTTFEDAILRHRGEARFAANRFRSLQPGAQQRLLRFLESL